jgi:serine/threonine protein kinase
MDLCGPSLEDLLSYCGRRFQLKTTLLLAEQLLHRLEYLHACQFIHRDIKPDNMVMGVGSSAHHLHLIDLGLARRYWDQRLQRHVPFREGRPLTGTARYCSINCHLGAEQSRRDDVESAGYVFIYLLLGHLPWQGIRVADPEQRTTRIGERKMSTPIEVLCRDVHPVFAHYLRYCRQLRFEEEPAYERLRAAFREAYEREGFERDWVFDWVHVRRRELAAVAGPAQVPLPPPIG